VGLAISIGRSGAATDDIVVCSFGDASLNHSTAQGALNWAEHSAFRGIDTPVMFVCEDNGLGISVPSPAGWVEERIGRLGMETASVEGHDAAALVATSQRLAAWVRTHRRPAVLHLRTVRFLAHAGSDAESAYRAPHEIRGDYAFDPIAGSAQLLIDAEECSGSDLVEWYLAERSHIRDRSLAILDEPELRSADEVMAPIAANTAADVRQRALEYASAAGVADPSDTVRRTLAQTITATLAEILRLNPAATVFGEDVGRKGGVYGVTRGLQKEFGDDRVFDTLLDEQSVLGLALGLGVGGGLPIPEIQYLAYLHNAEDQLRGEAATLRFFSRGQYRNPMVVRIAAYAYQRGFGGHFHNDNSIAVLRDIPGLVIASPSHPSDAGPMLRTCAAAAEIDGTVAVFLEPIARYHTTDLVEGDGQWTAPTPTDHVPIGSGRVHGDGSDATVVTWGNGLWLSLRAQRRLADEHGVNVRVLDLRWLAPLPVEDLISAASATGRVFVADETRRTGGVGEGLIAALVDGGFAGRIGRASALDSFVPLGAAAELVLLSEDDIVSGVVKLCR
jgi:2-oxoisovalerate dehydrogenase E1 component